MKSDEPDPPPTESLVDAYRTGAEGSFAQLYERLVPALYAWAALRAPRGVDPADLVGDVWLHAVRSMSRYDPARATFRAWLFGVAKKVLLRALRDLERAEPHGERADVERVPDSVTSLSRRYERDDSMLRFLQRIEALEQEERDLVVYCGLEGFTCGEAAVRLGLSEAAATKRWQRLRAELRATEWVVGLLA